MGRGSCRRSGVGIEDQGNDKEVSIGDAVGQSLPYAVGIAVSPVPIAALLLMLVTKKARTNAPLFLLGWIAGLSLVGGIVLLIPGFETSEGGPSFAAGVVKGVLGLLLLVMGARAWRSRPRPGETAEPPAWMDRVDGLGGGGALGLGLLLSGANPKNLLLAAAGAATISSAGLMTGQKSGSLAIFVLVASLTILVPVVLYFVLGMKAESAMSETKEWLIQNNQTVMAVLILVIAVSLIGDSIEILF